MQAFADPLCIMTMARWITFLLLFLFTYFYYIIPLRDTRERTPQGTLQRTGFTTINDTWKDTLEDHGFCWRAAGVGVFLMRWQKRFDAMAYEGTAFSYSVFPFPYSLLIRHTLIVRLSLYTMGMHLSGR